MPSDDQPFPSNTESEKQVPRMNKRSHEKNQERAYIAASRRADRSLEARMQSARMASQIHKKRTGKGFKITERIVLKEEMYEEEDNEFPRHYRAFVANLQTASPDMNNRLNDYLTNQIAIVSLTARHDEINRQFAEQFPNARRILQMSGHSNHNTYSTRHTSIDTQIPPTASPPTVGSGTSHTVSTPITSYSSEDGTTMKLQGPSGGGVPMDPSLTMSTAALLKQQPPGSCFTSELPQETKMLVSDIHPDILSEMYGCEVMGSIDYFRESPFPPQYGMPPCSYAQPLWARAATPTAFDYPEAQTTTNEVPSGVATQGGGTGTPGAHVDFDQWITEPYAS